MKLNEKKEEKIGVWWLLDLSWWDLKTSEAVHTFQNIAEEMVFCYQNCSDLLWEKIVPKSLHTMNSQK